MNNVKQPFIIVENITLRLIDEITATEEFKTISVYGFTSKFYLLSSFAIVFLVGGIASRFLFKC